MDSEMSEFELQVCSTNFACHIAAHCSPCSFMFAVYLAVINRSECATLFVTRRSCESLALQKQLLQLQRANLQQQQNAKLSNAHLLKGSANHSVLLVKLQLHTRYAIVNITSISVQICMHRAVNLND
jgi:hypothetical protein